MAENQKWTIEQIRETASRINNPGVSVEDRQQALTSLFVELCDRVVEDRDRVSAVTAGTGAAIRRLTEESEGINVALQTIQNVINGAIAQQQAEGDDVTGAPPQMVMAGAPTAMPPEHAAAMAAAAAPQPAPNTPRRKGSAEKPAAPATIVPPNGSDAAAVAAAMSGTQGAAVVPIASVQTK